MALVFHLNHSSHPSTPTSIRYNLSSNRTWTARLASVTWTCLVLIALNALPRSASQVYSYPYSGHSGDQSVGYSSAHSTGYQIPDDAMTVCEEETFNVSCSRNEVILIRWAMYGRIRENLCLRFKESDRSVANVLPDVEMECSGMKRCVFTIYSMRDKHKWCHKDPLRCSLEIQYSCIAVSEPPNCDVTAITEPGTLASVTYGRQHSQESSEMTSSPQTLCPWIIQAPADQWINLTMEDFSYGLARDNVEYGFISEIWNDSTNDIKIFGGSSKKSWIYISYNNTVNVTLNSDEIHRRRFLIHYSVVGCSTDNIASKDSWIKQIDRFNIIVLCNFTDEQWELKCIGNHWTGTVTNRTCSVLPSAFIPNDGHKEELPYSVWILLALGVAIGVALGVVLLVAILFFMKRSKTNRELDGNSHPAVVADHRLKGYHASCASLSHLDGSMPYSCKIPMSTPSVAFDDYDAWNWHQRHPGPDPCGSGVDGCGVSCMSTMRRPSDCAESILSNSVAGSTLYRPAYFQYRNGDGQLLTVTPCGSCATTNRNYSPQHSDRQFHSPHSDRHKIRTLDRSAGPPYLGMTNPMQARSLPPVPLARDGTEDGIYSMAEDDVQPLTPSDPFYFQLDPTLTRNEADHSQPDSMNDCKACSQQTTEQTQ